MPFTNFAGTLILHIHLLFALVSARAYASPAPQVTPAPTAPWADCKLESAAPCHGIVYDPPSWCQAQATNIMYYPISSATGTAACDFTKEPTTSVERLGILSTYAAAERTSCLTYLGLTAVVTEPTTIALTKTSTSSTESVASKTTKSTSSAVSTLTPKQKGQLETYLKNAKIAGGFGFTGVITFTTILGIVNLDVHLVAAAEQAAAGAAGNVLELFLGTDVTEAVWTSFVAISLGAMAGALLVALAMVPFFIYEIIEAKIVEFRNNDDKKWPKTMTAYNKDAAGAEAAWAIRLFSDEGCGNHPLNYGSDPDYIDGGNPVMMAEYASSDKHYTDLQPCQNFMVHKDHQVSSVAVMISAAALGENPASIFLFSHPQCSMKLDPCGATKDAPNGTFPMTQYLLYQDYMQIHNGSAQVYGDKSLTDGAWHCYKGNFQSFTVVFDKVTNIDLDKDYQITADKTVPAAEKAAVKDYGHSIGKGPYLTTDIGNTWQDGSRQVPSLFGAGRGRSSDLEGGDGC